MTIRTKLLFTLILFAGLSVSAFAETVYVSDELRVGIRPEPDIGYSPVGVVVTGMKLDVLDRQAGFVKIKTDDGMIGWIKDIYATDKKPAMLRLQQLQKKHTVVANQLKEISKDLKTLESSNQSLNEQVEELKQERVEWQLLQAKLASSQQQAKSTWYWWLMALVVVLVGSFVGGIQWHRIQAMKRLGGLRV